MTDDDATTTRPVEGPARPLRVAALVKQIPAFEAMTLGADGRLVREGLPLEMSAYCRRAVAEAVRLVEVHGGSVTVITLGPPAAEDVLREALAYGTGAAPGAPHRVDIRAVHLCDPAFAGSDTLATAGALARVIALLEEQSGEPFDLVLLGRNSVDADTGQVPPQVAQLLDRPFVAGVKWLVMVDGGDAAEVGCELDDLWEEAVVRLPAVVSTAERLIDPCKIKDPTVLAAVDGTLVTRWSAADLGPGPWGAAGSPTTVGETRTAPVTRARMQLAGAVARQVEAAVDFLAERGLLPSSGPGPAGALPAPVAAAARPEVPVAGGTGPPVVVVLEPGRPRIGRELLGAAASLAADIGAPVVAIGAPVAPEAELATWGADAVVRLGGSEVGEDVAVVLGEWCADAAPWAVLVGGTPWGREVAARLAALLGAGLVGDAIGLEACDGRLLAWKPAFGGAQVAAIRCTSPVQMATVRPGTLEIPIARPSGELVPSTAIAVPARGRVVITARRQEDDLDLLVNAPVVVGVGQGVDPERYSDLDGLLRLWGAELACTRKVTDRGWMPHVRQLGITGKSIGPRLYIALGVGGKYNHTVGVRAAGTILAVNPDPDAPIFGFADVGIVGEWQEVVPELERQLLARAGGAGGAARGAGA